MKIRNHKGRASQFNLQNRFEKIHIDDEFFGDENFDFEDREIKNAIKTEYFNDTTKSVLTENNSPDIRAKFSINPYRGCEHGCIYCYARPTHEYLGFSSGLDFETKIMVKHKAPELLRKEFLKKKWKPQAVFFSGNTDCYQPMERRFELTRNCLKVFNEFRNPVLIITKNALVKRDTDILTELSKFNLIKVIISITTLNSELQRKMEPRTSSPFKRLETIQYLSKIGIPTGVNIAPIIPGLTEKEIPEILRQSSESGAKFSNKVILRLPYSVKVLFEDWLKRNFYESSEKILNRIKEIHGGELYNSAYGKRLTGEGKYAELINLIFDTNCKKYGLNEKVISLSTEHFRIPTGDQFSLFG